MLEWIFNNKEWFFWGIGVAIVGFVIATIRSKSKADATKPNAGQINMIPETGKMERRMAPVHFGPTDWQNIERKYFNVSVWNAKTIEMELILNTTKIRINQHCTYI